MKKYKLGNKVETRERLLEIIKAKGPVYWRHKYLHYDFYRNWMIRTLESSVEAGVVFEVERNK